MTDDVLQLEERRWAALLASDFDTLDELTHPQLSYTHSNAVVDTKDAWIGSMTGGLVDYLAVEREDIALITSGTTAIITGKATFTVALPDREIVIVARFTAVWVNENGNWQFLAWQNTPIPR